MKTQFTEFQLHTGRCGSFGPFSNIRSSNREPRHQLSDIRSDGRGLCNQVTSSRRSKRSRKIPVVWINYQLF